MGGQKAAILAQVGQIYLDAVGQFCIGANNSRQVSPITSHLQVGHVTDPHLVRPNDLNGWQAALNTAEEGMQARQAAIQLRRTPPNSVLTHHALDPTPPDTLARSG